MRKSNIKIFKKNNYCLTIATKRDAKHKVKSLKKKGFIAYIQKYKIILNKKNVFNLFTQYLCKY